MLWTERSGLSVRWPLLRPAASLGQLETMGEPLLHTLLAIDHHELSIPPRFLNPRVYTVYRRLPFDIGTISFFH